MSKRMPEMLIALKWLQPLEKQVEDRKVKTPCMKGFGVLSSKMQSVWGDNSFAWVRQAVTFHKFRIMNPERHPGLNMLLAKFA